MEAPVETDGQTHGSADRRVKGGQRAEHRRLAGESGQFGIGEAGLEIYGSLLAVIFAGDLEMGLGPADIEIEGGDPADPDIVAKHRDVHRQPPPGKAVTAILEGNVGAEDTDAGEIAEGIGRVRGLQQTGEQLLQHIGGAVLSAPAIARIAAGAEPEIALLGLHDRELGTDEFQACRRQQASHHGPQREPQGQLGHGSALGAVGAYHAHPAGPKVEGSFPSPPDQDGSIEPDPVRPVRGAQGLLDMGRQEVEPHRPAGEAQPHEHGDNGDAGDDQRQEFEQQFRRSADHFPRTLSRA